MIDQIHNKLLGIAQTWQAVTANRAFGVTYTNTTGKPITVAITGNRNISTTTNPNLSLYIDEIMIMTQTHAISGNRAYRGVVFGVVPPGSTYRAVASEAEITLLIWSELRSL